MSHTLRLEFRIAVPELAQLPDSRAEVAVIGRSNVGKSSLINALSGGTHARASKKPGRTQLLTCFAMHQLDATFVDCPGYGYAKAPRALRNSWQPMLERYLLGREALVMVLLLVDGEIGPTDSDLEMLAWLRDNARPHSVVATKLDKVKPSQLGKRQRELASRCHLPMSAIFWVSAAENEGISRLGELVRLWVRG